MKRKHKIFLAILSLCVFVVSAATSNCDGQDLKTSSANQAQFYGQWQPPAASNNNSNTPTPDPTKDRFRELFPPKKLEPMGRNPAPVPDARTQRYPLQPMQPAPMAESLPRARPLQPIGQSNFIQGSFSQEPTPGGDFARVNHHEASTAEAAMPLPKLNNNWQDLPPSAQPWLKQTDAAIDTATDAIADVDSEIEGFIESLQTGGKDFWSQFQSEGGWGGKVAGFFGGSNAQTKKVFGSLAVVIGGYLAFVWLMRKFNFSSNRGIPSEVIEVIGNAPFGPRKNLQLVRLGSKLLLLMNGPEGTHPVGEITDPEEVDYLISLCNGKSTKATGSVMSAIGKLGRETRSLPRTPGRTLHPTTPPPTEATFSTSQLVQALESIQGTQRSNTVFEA